MKPRILIAGFGPFPGAAVNPSGRLVLDLARSPKVADRAILTATVIPTIYEEVFARLSHLLSREKPDGVLLFGLAGTASGMRIETRAVNFAARVYPDAAGQYPKNHNLVAEAPSFLRTRAPVQRFLAAARIWDPAAQLSINAGSYICNAALFHCLDVERRTRAPKLVAFVHIPFPRERRSRKYRAANATPPQYATLLRAAEGILSAAIAALRA
jgi:pyroglutamyl-peptidase